MTLLLYHGIKFHCKNSIKLHKKTGFPRKIFIKTSYKRQKKFIQILNCLTNLFNVNANSDNFFDESLVSTATFSTFSDSSTIV